MEKIATQRIQSLDLLKGVVLVIMALDYTRSFFITTLFFVIPIDLLQKDACL
ncbi:MAG: putative membrane protein [Paraglaciecola sp.]|jgi:uncharacterized membrane protein|uniref:hypothetical protein n=1 Tax=Polaribacter sp. TaxID=1920175 RepID=UPI003AD165B9